MAKYSTKNKDKKPKIVIHPDQNGKIGAIGGATLSHSKITGRYNLIINNELNLSESYHACIYRAKKKGVVWDVEDKEK